MAPNKETLMDRGGKHITVVYLCDDVTLKKNSHKGRMISLNAILHLALKGREFLRLAGRMLAVCSKHLCAKSKLSLTGPPRMKCEQRLRQCLEFLGLS